LPPWTPAPNNWGPWNVYPRGWLPWGPLRK
jgi:hypothetical protein